MGRQSKEYQAFVQLTDKLLAVPRATVEKRLAEHREKVAAQDPESKRGPKPKTSSGVSSVRAAK